MRRIRFKTILSICAAMAVLLAWASFAEAQEDQGPRFFRCSAIGERFAKIRDNDVSNAMEVWLHGAVPTGTGIELLALGGSGRNSTVVPYDSGLIYESWPDGQLSMTQIPLEAGLGLGPIALAVTPPGLPYEDLALTFLPEGESPPAPIEEWFESAERPGYYKKIQAYTRVDEAGIPLNLLLLTIDPRPSSLDDMLGVPPDLPILAERSRRYNYTLQSLVAVTQTSEQSFLIGHHGTYKLFRLGGRLYLLTETTCHDCTHTNGLRIHVFQEGKFSELYVNTDRFLEYR